ncbi:MAG: Dam family site-specific DNA-(adenine-N6)-methyltransferase [Acidobacteria bacterium]|nr:MAG: Dam family site-specific DNA-(adenine-N6)-methyltransferase [Acidobacteriota bacterium]
MAEARGQKAEGKGQNVAVRPLLKWAGGKRQLLPILRRFYPAQFNRYWEPFLGSAAVFFDLHERGLLGGREATLSDSNPDLIACYRSVRDCPDKVVDELQHLAREHQRRGSDHYYEVRDLRFNPQRAALAASAKSGDWIYSPALAAMFIYLNRTGYNGLFRLNSAGAFNVPAGRYENPRICDEANLHRVSAALTQTGITLGQRCFDTIVDTARPGDFLYFDPPYAPLSRTARFTNYTAEGFDVDGQRRLRDAAIVLARRGCRVAVSNSTAPEIVELYEGSRDVRAAGFHCHRVPARRAINSNGTRRGVVEEYIITNVR